MKVQITAQSLAAACERALTALQPQLDLENQQIEAERAERNRKLRWWEAFTMIPPRPCMLVFARIEAQRLNNLRAIARHKRPEAILEFTDQELEGIAPYLAVYEDHGGRV